MKMRLLRLLPIATRLLTPAMPTRLKPRFVRKPSLRHWLSYVKMQMRRRRRLLHWLRFLMTQHLQTTVNGLMLERRWQRSESELMPPRLTILI